MPILKDGSLVRFEHHADTPDAPAYRCTTCGQIMGPWCLCVFHVWNPEALRPRPCRGWMKDGGMVPVYDPTPQG
jgi:hypothetical protein